jgi:hypothetical protein
LYDSHYSHSGIVASTCWFFQMILDVGTESEPGY